MDRNKQALLSIVVAGGLLGALAVVDTAGGRGEARAENQKVEAKRSADVFATPGEQSRVVTRVRAGKEMVVLQTKNRWYKVRVNGRTGWITRTNVRPIELVERAPRAKRRRPFVEGRSTRRGSRGKAPTDRIGADATEEELIEDDDSDRDDRSRRERRRAALKRKRAQAREMGRDDEIVEDELVEEGLDEEELDDEGDLDEEDDDEPEREVVVVKVASIDLREEPDADSDALSSFSEGDRLYVVERDGGWVMVESDDGDSGWVRAADVEASSSSGQGEYRWEKLAIRATAGLGYSTIGQAFISDGTDPRSSYRISAGAAVIGAGGDVLYDYSDKFLIGGDLGYRFYYSSPGIRYTYQDQATNIGFKIHQLDLGARGGYKISKKSGMAAYARLGYHYERFGVDNVSDFTKNLAYLPTEALQGVTLGGIFEMPRITPKISGRASLDALALLGKRAQTPGLQDGAQSSAFAMWASLFVQYAWQANLKFHGSYQYSYAKTSWSGTAEGSMRPHATDSTSAQRKDGAHLFMLGVGRSF